MNWENKTLLLVGGTGSFGTNFIKYFLKTHTPKRIRLYSRDEHKQSDLINDPYYGGVLNGFIGDIRDKDRLRRAMEGVDVVLHAAALKMVQSCEYNPFEAIKTNILGSMNVVDCALDVGVEKVMAISTDKAVSPLNLYGATKMCMEKLLVQSNSYKGKKKTKISCCRYGNVANSRGSVIPLWNKLAQEGKPLPITNPRATRFWLDMEKAIDFVTECLDLMLWGGEIFVPKIPSVKMVDVANSISPNTIITGDRIGDKLHETLVSQDEMNHSADLGDKFIINPQLPQWEYHPQKGDSCIGRAAYTSDTNTHWLNQQEIKERLGKL